MRSKRIAIFMVCVLALSILFVGCTARRPMTNNYTNPNKATTPMNTGRTTNYGTTNYGTTNNGNYVNPNNAANPGYTGANNLTGNSNYTGNNTAYNYGTHTGTTGTGTTGMTGTTTNYNNRTGLTSGNYGTPGALTGTTNVARRPMNTTRDLQALVDKVPGVRKSTVVVLGNTAYVGVDTTGTTTSKSITDLNALKAHVANTIRNADGTVSTVYVSTDADFRFRLGKVAAGVQKGTSVHSFTNELTQMTKNLVPQR